MSRFNTVSQHSSPRHPVSQLSHTALIPCNSMPAACNTATLSRAFPPPSAPLGQPCPPSLQSTLTTSHHRNASATLNFPQQPPPVVAAARACDQALVHSMASKPDLLSLQITCTATWRSCIPDTSGSHDHKAPRPACSPKEASWLQPEAAKATQAI